MSFLGNNKLRIAMVPEVTAGVVPSSPAFQILRVTRPSGGATKQVFRSEQFDGTRFGRKNYLTGIDVAPSYDFEFSYGTFDALLAAMLRGTWSTNVLKDAATAASFTFEEAATDGSSFVRFLGCFPDELTLSIASRKEITGSLKFFGMSESSDTSALSSATYAAATTSDVMTSGIAVGALSITGLTDQPRVKSLDLTIRNGLGAREKLGSLYSMEPTASPIEIEAKLTAYFETPELYRAAMDHGSGALSFQLGSVSGSKYQVDIPAFRFAQVDRTRQDLRQDQMIDLTGRAEYDGSLGATMKFTRAVS